VKDSRLQGVLTRKEAEAALKENRTPTLAKTATLRARANERAELPHLLIESETHFVIMLERKEGE